MVEHTYTDWLAPSFGANSCEGLSLQLDLAKFIFRLVITKLTNRNQVENKTEHTVHSYAASKG